MSRDRAFHQLDVFSSEPLRGNPLAVVHDAEGLSDREMQAFARWTNLSETTFLLPPRSPDADYRVRIFTPRAEMEFAGHPTLGSCQAWLAQGGSPRKRGQVVQECNIGLVTLRDDGARLAFAAPICKRSELARGELAAFTHALGIREEDVEMASVLDSGTVWVGLLLRDAQAVLALEPDHEALRRLRKVGVVGPYAAGAPCQLELRAFAACHGIPEDPVTGSLNAAVAQWLYAEQRLPERYVAAQGARLERAGRVYVERVDDVTWVGGEVVVRVSGTLRI
jgi:PhzF family phenazine biosynthesis protein